MDPASPERFELPIEVREEDIDVLGHVNNVVYLRWVQDVAVAHWNTLASPEDREALVWVVVRHEIDYRRPVFRGDEVVARTWVGQATRRTFERLTELVKLPDDTVVARARTLWCPLDARTYQPTDVSSEVRARFSVPGD